MDSLTCLLDLGDGQPPIPCCDAYQALLLARLYVAMRAMSPPADTGSASPIRASDPPAPPP